MKKRIIFNLANSALMYATSHTLSPKDAYPLYKFKREVERIGKEIEDERQGIVKSVFGDDAQHAMERLSVLQHATELSDKEKIELDEITKKESESNSLINEMLDDEATLDGIKPMSYDAWHLLCIENKDKSVPVMIGNKHENIVVDIFSYEMEKQLENILWEAPKENDF